MFPNANELEARKRKDVRSALLVLFLLAGLSYVSFAISRYEMKWSAIWDYRRPLFSGWMLTVGIASIALVASTLIGILVVLGRYSRFSFIRGLVTVLVEFSRGMPLLVLIVIGYHVIAPQVHLHNRIVIGTGILSIFSGAYLGEIFRGGIESVPASQILAAKAVGFDNKQIARFILVPQAMRRVLPAVAGQFANLIKDSSLLYVISIKEFNYAAREVMATNYANLEVVVVIAGAYLILTLPMFWVSRRLERTFSYTS